MSVSTGSLVTKADIINYYNSQVPPQSAGALTTVPHANFATSYLGPALANPSTASLEEDIEAADIVQLLRDHAYNLTRYKKSTWIITGDIAPAGTYKTNILYRMSTAYRAGYSNFDAAKSYGPIIADNLVTASGMLAYVARLKALYIYYRDQTSSISVCHGSCHSSCHTSCHGSRGRR